MGAPISPDDFRTLNRCLDNAIAGAVTESRSNKALTGTKQFVELENLTNAAIVGFQAIRAGNVGVGGHTSAVVERSLQGHKCLCWQRHRLLAADLHSDIHVTKSTFFGVALASEAKPLPGFNVRGDSDRDSAALRKRELALNAGRRFCSGESNRQVDVGL